MKTFAAAALLAVFTSAQPDSEWENTGVSRFNSIDGVLVTVTEDTSLNYYYYFGGNEATDEFHGDFTLAFPDTDMAPDIEFGFCFLLGAEAGLWDCMRVRTTIDLEALAGETNELLYDNVQDYQVADIHSKNNSFPGNFGSFLYTQADQLNDDANVDDQSSQNINWRLSPSKSFKSGCVAGEAEGTVRCDWINAHWFRNFETLQKEQDIQLNGQADDQAYTAYGWIAQYPNGFEEYNPDNHLVAATPNGEGINIFPNAARAARAAMTEEQKADMQAWEATLNPRNGELLPVEESEDEDGDDDGEDGDGEDGDGEDGDGEDGDGEDGDGEDGDGEDGEDGDGEDGDDEDGDGEDGDDEDGDGEDGDDSEDDGDSEDEGDDSEDDAGDSDDDTTGGETNEGDEKDGAADVMTYAAAMITAFGALLI